MIILDGKNITDFGFMVEPGYEDPITPNFERKTMAISGRPGLWDFGTEVREKALNYPLKMFNVFHDDMQRAYNELVAFLFDDFGRPRPIKLVREFEPDKFYTVKVVEDMLPDKLEDESNLILSFVADDPYKYSRFLSEEVTWGSEDITFEFNYLLGHEAVGGGVEVKGPQTINVSVEGLALQPIFEIEGAANNLEISANGYSFKIPNFSNTKWEIDFEHYLVWKNGKETMIEIRDFYLMPGKNEVKINGNNINLDMRIKFRDKYN